MKQPRRSKIPSQATLDKRMREIWIDGFGFLPQVPKELQIDRMREALRRVVEDDLYWTNLKKLIALKDDVSRMIERLKAANASHAEASEPRRRSNKK